MLLTLGVCFLMEASQAQIKHETFPNDPLNAQIYTLQNGLKVYITVFKDEPRIQTYIAVKAGSKYDPKETTGLAHYLEHMLFKGTERIATSDWEDESKLLQTISDLFEKHKNATDQASKNAIYHQIDSLSFEASKYAVPNEYDKMISSIGAKGTNAFTSNDETVYVNDIPSNEFDKWCKLESERFQHLVLRLFHTELETVYEEFNRSQDNDGRWSFQKVMDGLLPNHPYGTQTTIGEGEHLKNPSMVNIHNYFDTYYRPNNIAICISGDIDPESAIKTIEKYFGSWKVGEIPKLKFDNAPEIKEPIVKETFGPQAEHLYLGYRFGGMGSADEPYVKLIDMLLANGKAGLIDLDLNQKQKVQNAGSFVYTLNDYSIHFLNGVPRKDQKLEEVKDLLLAEIEKIKAGDFSEELLKAVITDFKYREMKELESNDSRAFKLVDAFISGKDYGKLINEIDEMSKITKDELVAFANEHYQNNYVVSYKRLGEDKERHKVDKPEITPLEIVRDKQSEFLAEFSKMESPRLTPKYIDFNKDIQKSKLKSGIEFNYIHNEINKTFRLSYIVDLGSYHDPYLTLAIRYLQYLGTAKYSAEQLQMELFKHGLSFDVNTNDKDSRIELSGLDESLEFGIKLMEEILNNPVVDAAAYKEMVQGIIKDRQDAKLNKGIILFRGLMSYSIYGEDSPFRDILTEEQLNQVNPQDLVDRIKKFTQYNHHIFYYGSDESGHVAGLLNKYHTVSPNLPNPPAKEYVERETPKMDIYFYNFDMVQTEFLLLHKSGQFDPELAAYAAVFNEYFGSGLSSIVFQEIREQKALAYAAFASYRQAREKNEADYVFAYIGTQADKLPQALPAIEDLLKKMPYSEEQFQNAKESAMKKIETDYITGASIYWTYEANKKKGIDYDYRKQIYSKLQTMTFADLEKFFNEQISGKNYSMAIIGNKDKVDMDYLKKSGNLHELTDKEVFNY